MLKLLLLCSVGFLMCFARITFTNLKCTYAKESYGVYKECRIRAVNRTHKYISIYGNMRMKPVDNVTVNGKVLRNDHGYGYKPFFINITIDACKYVKNPNSQLINMFYNTFKKYSNINHTCPYDHDIIVDKLWTGNQDADIAQFIPIINGDYIFSLTFYANNLEYSVVSVYFKKTN